MVEVEERPAQDEEGPCGLTRARQDAARLDSIYQEADKAAAKAKEIGNLYTSKGIGGTTVIELGKKD